MAIFKLRNLESGQATPIPEGEFTMGRNDDAYIHVEDGMVSRRHAKLFNTEHGIFIEDAGSGNGTIVRGVKIAARTQLEMGDQIQLGPTIFRVEPEKAGETSAAPSAGTRTLDRAYMRKNTERIPVMGEPERVVEVIAPGKLSAPDVNPSDAEAEELNAVVMREPEAPDALHLPILRRGLTPLPDRTAPKPAVAVPTPQSVSAPKLKAEPAPESPAATPAPAPAPQPQAPATGTSPALAVSEAAPGPGKAWGWGLLIFLAGMGTGLLLGFVIARIFLELGGKVGALP